MSQGCGCGPKKEKEPCGCDKIKSSEALSAPSSTAKKCRCSSASNRSIPQQQQQQYYCPQYTNQRQGQGQGQGQFSTSPSAASAYSNDDDRALWNTAMIVDYGGSGSSSNQRRKSALQYPKNVQYPPTTAYDNYSTGTAESEVDALSNADSQYSMETSTSVEYVYEEYTYPDPDNPDLDKQVKVYKKKSITMYPEIETQGAQQTNSYPQKTAQLALTYPQQQATSYGKKSSSSPYSQQFNYSAKKASATTGAVLPYSGTGKTGMTGRSGGGQRASSALQSYNTGNYQQVSKKRSYTKTTTKMVYDDSAPSSKNYNNYNYSLPQNRQPSSYAAANAAYSAPPASRSGGYNYNNYNYNSKRSPYAASSIPAAPPLPLAAGPTAPLTFACPSSCSMNSSPSSYDQQFQQNQQPNYFVARKVPTVKYPDDVDAYPGGGFSDYNYSDKTFTVPSPASFGPRRSPALPSQGTSSNHCPSSCSGASSRYPSAASSKNYNSGASSSNYYSALSSHSSSSNNGPASYGAAGFGGISAIRPRSPLSCSLSEDKKKGTFSPFDGRILTASGAIPPSPKDKSSCYCTALSSTKLDDSELWNKSMHESLIEEYLEEPKMPALFKEDENSSSSAANKSGIKISACKCKSKDDTSSSTASTLTSTEKKEKKPCCCDKKKNVKIEEETQSKSSKEKLCACSTKSSINAEKVTTIICQDKAPVPADVEKEIQVQGGEEKKSPKPCCCSSKKEKAKKEEEEQQQKSSYTPKNKKQEARKKRSREEEPIYTKKEIKTVQNQVTSKPERSATRNRNNNNMPCGCSIKDSQSSKKSYKDASLNEQERRLYGKDLDPNAKCKKAHVECESEYLCYCDIKDARSHRRSDSETSVKKTNCCMPAKKKKKKKNVIPRDLPVATLEVEESYEDFDFDEEAEPNGTSTPQEIEDDNRLKQLEDEEREELLKKLTEFQKKKRKLIKKRSSH